jgi:hypothetical protein
MERMRQTFEDFNTELRKMGANDAQVDLIANGLADMLFFSISSMGGTSDEGMKRNIVRDARQKAVLYLRAIKLKGVDKFDPEKVKFDEDSEESFASFGDVSWDIDDDDEDYEDDSDFDDDEDFEDDEDFDDEDEDDDSDWDDDDDDDEDWDDDDEDDDDEDWDDDDDDDEDDEDDEDDR